MVGNELGKIHNDLYKLGFKEIPVFLLDGPQPVIFDAGVTCAARIYVEAIRSVLGERQPAILFLTHAHWDHCGAAAYLQRAFPGLKVAASPLAGQVMQRPKALTLISRLNAGAATRIGDATGLDASLLVTDPFLPFTLDIELQDGQIIELAEGISVHALATPGHTQDHFSYYLPHQKILIAGEACGVYSGPETVSTEFASDYEAYLASLLRLTRLPVEVFCQGHYQYLLGSQEIEAFFQRSIDATTSLKERVLELLEEEDGQVDRVVARIKTERYDPHPLPKQPEVTYLLNLQAQVAHLASRRGKA